MEEMEPDDLEELADEEVKNVVEELLGSKFIGAVSLWVDLALSHQS